MICVRELYYESGIGANSTEQRHRQDQLAHRVDANLTYSTQVSFNTSQKAVACFGASADDSSDHFQEFH